MAGSLGAAATAAAASLAATSNLPACRRAAAALRNSPASFPDLRADLARVVSSVSASRTASLAMSSLTYGFGAAASAAPARRIRTTAARKIWSMLTPRDRKPMLREAGDGLCGMAPQLYSTALSPARPNVLADGRQEFAPGARDGASCSIFLYHCLSRARERRGRGKPCISVSARLALAATAFLLGAPCLQAQTPPPKPPAPAAAADAAFDAQKAAFLALPLSTRVAAQDALVWLGLYNGTSDGDFGKRTREFDRGLPDRPEGARRRRSLAGTASGAAGGGTEGPRGGRLPDDRRSGDRRPCRGAPKLITPKSGVTLDVASDPGGDLAALYARLSADGPERKVAYKAMKPGAFFVVSGRDGGKKFYARYELKTGASPPIRGFTFAYPTARNDLDRVALAVANAFEAFPGAGAPSAAGQPQPQPQAAVAPAPPQPARRPRPALLVAPGRALTALKPGDCPNPSVGGRPARFERSDRGDRARAARRRLRRRGEPPARGALAPDLVVVSADGSAPLGRPGRAGGRRKAGRRRLAREERRRRPGLRPVGRPRRPRRADRRGAATRRRRAARRAARVDRRRCDRRLPRRRRPDAASRPRRAQRGRDRGAREGPGRAGDLRTDEPPRDLPRRFGLAPAPLVEQIVRADRAPGARRADVGGEDQDIVLSGRPATATDAVTGSAGSAPRG